MSPCSFFRQGSEMTEHTHPLLQLDQLEVIYNDVIQAVRDISLIVQQGDIVALLGANGAGKSTTLKAISGLVQAGRGQITHGCIQYAGLDVTDAEPARLATSGLVQVLEGRHCFGQLTVEENLITGAFASKASRAELKHRLEQVYQFFPRLRERRQSKAGYTSGGEQQMVAIGRALMASPKLVLLDEPSMGLAPQIVEEIFNIVQSLNQQEGVSFLLAEQNATVALRYASRGYVIVNGSVASSGSAASLLESDVLHASYLGGRVAAA